MANFPSASHLDKRESVVVYVASGNKSMTTTVRERKKNVCSRFKRASLGYDGRSCTLSLLAML